MSRQTVKKITADRAFAAQSGHADAIALWQRAAEKQSGSWPNGGMFLQRPHGKQTVIEVHGSQSHMENVAADRAAL